MRKHLYLILIGLALASVALAARVTPMQAQQSAANPASPSPAQEPEVAISAVAPELPEVFSEGGDRGWLGVTIAEVTAEKAKELKLPAERGVVLSEVEADSPAAKAGLKANDVITEFNGQRVEGTAQFSRLVRETPAGRSVQLTVWREGRAQSATVQLGSFHKQMASHMRRHMPREFDFHFEMPEMGGNFFAMSRPVLGIDGENLSGQLGSYFGAPDGEGVLVREVKSGTPAEKAGLKAGDVITQVDGERVRTVSELRQKLHGKRDKKSVNVSVLRKGAEMSLEVPIEQPKPAEKKKLISRRTSI